MVEGFNRVKDRARLGHNAEVSAVSRFLPIKTRDGAGPMRCFVMAMTVVVATFTATAARAQGVAEESPADPTWYQESGSYSSGSYEPPTPLMIIQQKAQARAQARIRRIETNNAYGMSNARPTANATPFSGMYSPAWQMPGGRPFAWYSYRRPQYIFWR